MIGKQAEKGRDAAGADVKTADLYQKRMSEGWLALQSKRYDDAFRQAAVGNWIKTGQSGRRSPPN